MYDEVAAIMEWQVRRKFAIGLINRQTNAAGAVTRRVLGWRADMPEKERAKIARRAKVIVDAAIAGKEPPDDPAAQFVWLDLLVCASGIEPIANHRAKLEKLMEESARALPVWKGFAEGVRGFGARGLAVIIGEAGDLSRYPNPAKLWKRLGLAPIEKDGRVMAASTWRMKGGLTADDWVAAGYAPRRRAEIYAVVGEPLFRAQTPVFGPYRLAYDARRARTAETHSDWTKVHSHGDALRIMTKKLIVDLWSAWRATSGVNTIVGLPAAEEEAIAAVYPENYLPPLPTDTLKPELAMAILDELAERGPVLADGQS